MYIYITFNNKNEQNLTDINEKKRYYTTCSKKLELQLYTNYN